MEFHRYLDAARNAAQRAGEMLKENIGTPVKISFKGEVDLVTNFDDKSQEMIYNHLSGLFPGHDFLAEENLCQGKGAEYRWIIDPIDGTTNYAHRFPFFCVSVALERNGAVVLGVIYDPVREEMFTSVKGEGAFLNGEKIKVSDVPELDKSLLSTGFPYDVRESRINNIDHFKHFVVRAQGIRRSGSAALDLCYVACGRFDGFWELKLQPWDVAAGNLIVSEAGGCVTDFQNREFSINEKEILATNGLIHQQMMEVLRLSKPN